MIYTGLLIQVLECVKETGLDTGIDIGSFIAFVENPVVSMKCKDNKGDIVIQKTIQEFFYTPVEINH